MRARPRLSEDISGLLGAVLEMALAVAAGAFWYRQEAWDNFGSTVPRPAPVPLILLALVGILRLSRSLRTSQARAGLRPSALALPAALFALAVGLGLRAAYDPAPATAKAWLIAGAFGIAWAAAGQSSRSRLVGALAFWTLFGAGLGAFFLITHDGPALPDALQRLLQAMRAVLPAALAGETLNPNVAAGTLIVTLPLSIALVFLIGRRRTPGDQPGTAARRWPRLALLVLASGAALVAAAAWLLSTSRGAVPALGAAVALWGVWRLTARLPWRRRCAVLAAVAVAGGLASAALIALILKQPGGSALVRAIRDDLVNRGELARLGLSLVRDAPFTGIGPGMYEMAMAIYSLLIHVGFVKHSHNMLIDMAIELGALAPVAYLTAVAVALVTGYRVLHALDARSRASDAPSTPDGSALVVEAALVSLLAVVMHGLFDDALFGSRAVLFLFLPFGMLIAAVRATRSDLIGVPGEPATPEPTRSSEPSALALTTAGLLALGVALAIAQPWRGLAAAPSRLAGAWYANRGVTAQTRAELPAYDQQRFNRLTMDQIRRQEDLSGALALFERALDADATNVTANQRLASIALSRGDYDQALIAMERIWHAGARDRVTRLFYGDALVAAGRWEEAVNVVKGLQFAGARLAGQAWARYNQGDDPQRETWARSAAARLGD